ncbi:MAG: copper amine oxidase N-terminal domain-containing protein [Lachnospiraceae bacterium]|nr:copper amine oxidase N-terminal domain-containing protein [Lachnospiraceae bacterium]
MRNHIFVLIFALIALCQTAFAADVISVNVDGSKISFDQPPVIENGRILVPFRAILEPMGANISWDGSKKTITAIRGEKKISLTIGKAYIMVNGKKTALDVAPKIIGDRAMVPARAISESLGASVTWNEGTKSVGIYVETSPPAENSNAALKNNITNSKTLAFFQRVTSGNEWLIKLETKIEILDGKKSDVVLTMAQKSDKMLLNLVSGEGYDVSLITKEGKAYFVMNKERFYSVIESGEAIPGMENLNITESGFLPTDEEAKAIANSIFTTGVENIDNTEYKYEEFSNGTNFARFYFSGDELRYIKSDVGGENEALVKIIKASQSTANSLFEIPLDFTLIDFSAFGF